MIVLYNPVSSASRKPVLPMSLLAVGALLEGRHAYAIVDGNLDPRPEETIAAMRPDVLGVTVMPGPQLADAVRLCRALKARLPSLVIVWGGYFPTQHWEVCLRAPYVDHVLRGHSEHGFVALIDALSSGASREQLRAIPGVATRGPLMPHASPMGPIPDPDALPDFPYHRVDVPRYVRRTFMGQRTLPHHSSYGCPFTCNFCAVVNMVEGRWLAQSAERTAAVVKGLVERWGVDAVDFYDNNFFTHEARTRDFAERIAPLRIGWWGEARVDTLMKYSDATWSAMSRSGLRMVFLGAESGSDETLAAMNKGGTQTAAKALELAARMKRWGVVPEMSFVLGSPPDPEADIERTLAFIRRLKDVNEATEIIMYIYTPVPLSGALYDAAKADGFSFPETLEGWVSPSWSDFSQRRSTHVPWLADPVRRRLRDFQLVINAYHPTRTDPRFGPARRAVLKAAAALRYHLGVYDHPYELKVINRLLPYQRPETTGF